MTTRRRRRLRESDTESLEPRLGPLRTQLFDIAWEGPEALTSLAPETLLDLRTRWEWWTGVLTEARAGRTPTFEEILEDLGLTSDEIIDVTEAIRVSQIDFTCGRVAVTRERDPQATPPLGNEVDSDPERKDNDSMSDALALMSGLPRERIERWRPGDVARDPSEQLLNEMHQLWMQLREVILPEAIPGWLARPNDELGGCSPVEVLRRGDSERLRALAYHLEAGTPL